MLQSLEPQDAESIAALAATLYPEELQLEVHEIAEALEAAEEEGGNFSVGLVENGHLKGYMLAWLEESRLEGLQESVLLIDDLALPEGSTADLQKLLRNLVSQLEESQLAHLAIEGTAPSSFAETLRSLERFIHKLGYELVASEDYFEDELGMELTWVRYERPAEVEASVAGESWDGSEFVPEDEELEEFPE